MSLAFTTCGFCSAGCGMYVQVEGGRVIGVCGSANHPVSSGRLCIKGWNATPAILGPDRLKKPLVRKGDRLEPVTWEEAISFAASSIRRILDDVGPQGIGVIGSARTTNEECYSLVKFARSVIGTANIDGANRFSDFSLVPGLLATTGVPASQVDINALPRAGSMLIVGANVTEQLPHIGSRIEQAALNGCRIISVDPRVSRLNPHTHMWLHPKPGTDLLWARAMLKVILDSSSYAETAAELGGFQELKSSLGDIEVSQLKYSCWLEPEDLIRATQILADNPPVVVMFGLGVLQQVNSTELVKALADIALLLGGSVMPLRGQNNAQGASDVGLACDYLPGYAHVSDPAARKMWELLWNCKLPAEPGLSAVEMVNACGSGELKGLVVFGENVALSAPNTQVSMDALRKAEFLAVSDMYLTETASLAHVVFPACSFLEKDGTFTSIERRVQRVRKVVEPVGESKPDLEIIADLAKALGSEISREPAKILGEIAANVAWYRGLSLDKVSEPWGVQWKIPEVEPTLVLVADGAYQEKAEYPFLLIASRQVYNQHTGTVSARCPVLLREYPETYAELNEADAERLGLRPNREIRISSEHGSILRILMLNDGVPQGCIHVPHFFGGDSPNALASYECDPISGVPVYKTCSVKVEAVK